MEESKWFLEKSIHSIPNSDNPKSFLHELLLRRSSWKNLEVTLIFVDFSKAFDSIHREKMEQIFLLSSQRNYRSHNNALQKHDNKSSLIQRWHRILWHCRRCSARRYTSPILVHNLPRLCTSNIDRFNERNR